MANLISNYHQEQFYPYVSNTKRKYEEIYEEENVYVIKRSRCMAPQINDDYQQTATAVVCHDQTPVSSRYRGGNGGYQQQRRIVQHQQPNLIISNPLQYKQYSQTHVIEERTGYFHHSGAQIRQYTWQNETPVPENNYQNIYEKSLDLVRRWKEGGFYMEVYYCSACQLPFENTDRIKDHIDYMHINNKGCIDTSACRGCGEFVGQSELTNSSTVVADLREKHEQNCSMVRPHKCDCCSKRFVFDKRLSNHIKICGQKNLTCRVCSNTFKDEHMLKYHMVLHAFV